MRMRIVLIAAVLGVAAIGMGSSPAAAALPADRVPPGELVQDFFGGYLAAMQEDPPNTELARALRDQYITAEANARLDEWASENGADPIFRVDGVPDSFTVGEPDCAVGTCYVPVTETFGNISRDVVFRVANNESPIINDVLDPPVSHR